MRKRILFTMAATAMLTNTVLLAGNQPNSTNPLDDSQLERPSGPTDFTEKIINPAFDNQRYGWSGDTGVLNFGGAYSTPEVYNRWVDLYQTVTGLPNGNYTVTVQAAANNTGGRFFATSLVDTYQTSIPHELGINGNTDKLDATSEKMNKNPESYLRTLSDVLVVNGQLQIGIKWQNAPRNNWMVIDNFKLKYENDGFEKIKEAYGKQKSKAQELASNDNGIPELNKRLLDITNVQVTDDVDGYTEALRNLNTLLQAYHSEEASTLKGNIDFYFLIAEQDKTLQEDINAAIQTAKTQLASINNTEELSAINSQLCTTCNSAIATGEANMDITVNTSDFNSNSNTDGWIGGGTFADGEVEFYDTTFDFYKELYNLPNGWYQITVNAFCRQYIDGGANFTDGKEMKHWYIYGNDYALPVKSLYDEEDVSGSNGGFPDNRTEAQNCFANGKYENTVNILVTDGTLRFGIKGLKNTGRCWCCFDNLKLTYKGNHLESLYGELAKQAIENAKEINEAYQNETKQKIENGQPEEEYTTEDITSINKILLEFADLYNAIAQFKADGVIPKSWEEYNNLTNISTSTNEVLNTYRSSIEKAVEDIKKVTGTEQIESIKTSLSQARINYMLTATPTSGNQFDLTDILLRNPCSTGTTDGWASDITNGNNISISRSASYIGDTGLSCFVEKWSYTAFTQTDENGWLIYQSAALPVGSYKLTAAVMTDRPYNASDEVSGLPSARFTVGQEKTTIIKGTNIQWNEHEKETGEVPKENNKNQLKYIEIPHFYIPTAGTDENPIKLGIYIDPENQADWFGINDMKLYKVAPEAEALDLDETKEYAVKSDIFADVKLKRTLIANKWNTFCVPFDMTSAQIEENDLGEIRTLSQATREGESIVLTFNQSESIEAGKPYLVRPAQSVTQIVAKGVLATASEPSPAYSDGDIYMTGNYSTMTVPIGAYFINDDKFYLADTDKVNLKGFRAYINVDSESPVAGVNRLLIDIDGSVTSVGEVLDNTAEDGGKMVDVFTLSGVKVKAGVKKAEALCGLERGIYIVGGKKVIK